MTATNEATFSSFAAPATASAIALVGTPSSAMAWKGPPSAPASSASR